MKKFKIRMRRGIEGRERKQRLRDIHDLLTGDVTRQDDTPPAEDNDKVSNNPHYRHWSLYHKKRGK